MDILQVKGAKLHDVYIDIVISINSRNLYLPCNNIMKNTAN